MSKTDWVADRLRHEITQGKLAPGSMLRQRDIADRFGVSPTPVREALSRLEAEGLVTASLHRGASVVRQEKVRLKENYVIRATLEALATELACPRLRPEDFELLAGINEEMACHKRATAVVVELNRRFHMALYEATDSALLLAMLRNLWRALDGGPRVNRPVTESVEQHAAILDALRVGDAEGAASLVRQHILSASPLYAAS